MIRLRLNSGDLQRMRFAYSPLTEAAESLYMLHSGRITGPHRGWFENARSAIQRFDNEVLRAAVPVCGDLAHVFLVGATDATTSINEQLAQVAAYPPADLRADLELVWQGRELPPAAQRLIADGAAGARRLADAVRAYWEAALERYWRQIRMLLDADVAYRAAQLAKGGISAMMSDLHPAISVGESAFEIRARAHVEHDLAGAGILLIPSVFVWPYVNIEIGHPEETSLTYAARGVAPMGARCRAGRRRRCTCRTARPDSRNHSGDPGGGAIDHRPSAPSAPERVDDQLAPVHPAALRHGDVLAVGAARAV